MGKINDRILLGLVIGLTANIPKTLWNEYFYRKGIEKRRFGDLVAGIFLPYNRARSKKGTIFGFLGDMCVSNFLGILLVYLISFTGKDKAIIKGCLTGLLGFGLFRGILARIGIVATYPKDVATNAMMSFSSSLWGIIAGLLVPLIGHKDLFEPSPLVLSNPPNVVENSQVAKKISP